MTTSKKTTEPTWLPPRRVRVRVGGRTKTYHVIERRTEDGSPGDYYLARTPLGYLSRAKAEKAFAGLRRAGLAADGPVDQKAGPEFRSKATPEDGIDYAFDRAYAASVRADFDSASCDRCGGRHFGAASRQRCNLDG